MKLKLMVAAIGLLGTSAAMAQAIDAATLARVNAVKGTEREIFKTGASAIQNNVGNSFASQCGANPVIRFNHSTDGNVRSYLCQNALGVFNGADVLLNHSVQGGSLSAVLGTNAAAGPDQNSFIQDFSTCSGPAGGPYSCTDLVDRRGMGGILDLDPVAFAQSGVYTPGPTYPVSAPTLSAGGQVFTVVASLNLYRRMQQQQGITNDLGDPIPASCQDGAGTDDFGPQCQPNITKEAYTSIVSAGLTPYKQGWAALLGAGQTGPNGNVVKLCRRAATSGTQASSNQFFLTNPGSPAGQLGPLGANAAAGTSGTFALTWWFGNSGTSNVLQCLDRAHNGTNEDAAPPIGSPGPHYAIGVVSAENNWRTVAADRDDWRFLKLDGVSPEELGGFTAARAFFGRNPATDRDVCARESAIEGRYPFAYEFVLVRRTGITPNQNTFLGQIAGDGLFSPITPAATAPVGECAGAAENPPRGIFVRPVGATNHASNPTRVHKGSRGGIPYRDWNLTGLENP